MKYRIVQDKKIDYVVDKFDMVLLFDDKKQFRKTVTYVNEIYEYIEKHTDYKEENVLSAQSVKVGGEVNFGYLALEVVPDVSSIKL